MNWLVVSLALLLVVAVTNLIWAVAAKDRKKILTTNIDRVEDLGKQLNDLRDSHTTVADENITLSERVRALVAKNKRLDDVNNDLAEVWEKFARPDEIDTKAIEARTGETRREIREKLANGEYIGRKVCDEDRMTWVMRAVDVPSQVQHEGASA